MDTQFEQFIKELPAELQEQLKAATTQEEAMAILEANAIQLPDEALEAVAGGVDWARITTRPIY